MDDATRRTTLKRDKTGLLKSFLTANFWETFGRYLKNAAAATYRGPLLLASDLPSCANKSNASALPTVG